MYDIVRSNDLLLLGCCARYQLLFGETTAHMRSLILFVEILYPDIISGVDQSGTTHPSVVLRSKAILWYSSCDYFRKGEQWYSADQIRAIDNRIERDLTRFVDGIVKRRIEEQKKGLLLWMITAQVVEHGMFSKKAQSEMVELFGEDTVHKLRSFLAGLSGRSLETVN